MVICFLAGTAFGVFISFIITMIILRRIEEEDIAEDYEDWDARRDAFWQEEEARAEKWEKEDKESK